MLKYVGIFVQADANSLTLLCLGMSCTVVILGSLFGKT